MFARMSPVMIMRTLRAVSLTEGVSYLVLLGIAMPLKYWWGNALAVKYVGWTHGILFILLGLLALLAMWRAALGFRLACLVGIAALLPGGPFFLEPRLRRHQEKIVGGIPDPVS